MIENVKNPVVIDEFEKKVQQMEMASLDSLQKYSAFFLKMEIDSLRNYLPLFEKHILNDSEKIQEILIQWNETLPEKNLFTPESLKDKIKLEKIQMACFFRNSTFVSCFSLLETKLSELSGTAKDYLRIPFAESDLKNQGIEGSKEYLRKSIELKITERHEWQKLKLYQSVRNALVHNKGEGKTTVECSQIVKSLNGISKSADNFLYLSSDFIPNFLDILESFLNSVQTEAYARITEKYYQIIKN